MAITLPGIGGGAFPSFTDLNSIFGFAFNLVLYIGWAMMFIGVCYVMYSVIYRLMNTDNEEAVKEFRGAITKAIIIVILGLVLISLQAVVNVVGSIFGITVSLKPPF